MCVDSGLGPVALRPLPRFTDPAAQASPGSLLAPMPGTVARLGVGVGDQVARSAAAVARGHEDGARDLGARRGIVAELPVAAGQQVEVGSVLAVVKPEEDPE